MVDDVRARAVRRRARRVRAGDTVRLSALLLVVGVADAAAVRGVAGWAGWWAVSGVLSVLVVVPLVVVVARSASPAVLLVRAGVDRGESAGPDRDAAARARFEVRVRALAAAQGSHPPLVLRWPGGHVNAFSVGSGRSGVLCVGGGLSEALEDIELDAVVLHELNHLRRGSRVRAGAWVVAAASAAPWTVLLTLPGFVLAAATVVLAPRSAPSSVVDGAVRVALRLPVALGGAPGRLREAAAHRRDVLADLSAARLVGASAVREALGVLEAVLPPPWEVSAARASDGSGAMAPQVCRRCTAPILSVDEHVPEQQESLAERRHALGVLAREASPGSLAGRRDRRSAQAPRAGGVERARVAELAWRSATVVPADAPFLALPGERLWGEAATVSHRTTVTARGRATHHAAPGRAPIARGAWSPSAGGRLFVTDQRLVHIAGRDETGVRWSRRPRLLWHSPKASPVRGYAMIQVDASGWQGAFSVTLDDARSVRTWCEGAWALHRHGSVAAVADGVVIGGGATGQRARAPR